MATLVYSWSRPYSDGSQIRSVQFSAQCDYKFEANYSDTHARLTVSRPRLYKSPTPIAITIKQSDIDLCRLALSGIPQNRMSGDIYPFSFTVSALSWSANTGGYKFLHGSSFERVTYIEKTRSVAGSIADSASFSFTFNVSSGSWKGGGTKTKSLIIPHKPEPPANLYGVLNSAEQLQGSLSAEEQMKGSFNLFELPEYQYEGSYEFTPSSQTQYAPTAYMTCLGDIKINPIPSNYGLITYDGTIITVS